MTKNNHGVKWLFTPNGLSQSVDWHQDQFKPGDDRAGGMVAGRHRRDRVQSLLRLPRGRSALASAEQRQGAHVARGRTTIEPHGAMGQLTGFHRHQQQNLRHPHREHVNTLSLDAINSYDPMGGSYAFSPLGFSGSFAGFGDTEAARANFGGLILDGHSVPFFLGANFRVAGLVQWGGYDQGNGMNGLYRARSAPTLTYWGSPLSAASFRSTVWENWQRMR